MATYGITDWRKLGAVLREARLGQGLTQDELAEQAGVSRAWLAKLEAGGHRRAEIEQVFKLLAALSLEMVVRDKQRSAGESGLLAALGRSDYALADDTTSRHVRNWLRTAAALTDQSTDTRAAGEITPQRSSHAPEPIDVSDPAQQHVVKDLGRGQVSQRAQLAAKRRAAAVDRAAARAAERAARAAETQAPAARPDESSP